MYTYNEHVKFRSIRSLKETFLVNYAAGFKNFLNLGSWNEQTIVNYTLNQRWFDVSFIKSIFLTEDNKAMMKPAVLPKSRDTATV